MICATQQTRMMFWSTRRCMHHQKLILDPRASFFTCAAFYFSSNSKMMVPFLPKFGFPSKQKWGDASQLDLPITLRLPHQVSLSWFYFYFKVLIDMSSKSHFLKRIAVGAQVLGSYHGWLPIPNPALKWNHEQRIISIVLCRLWIMPALQSEFDNGATLIVECYSDMLHVKSQITSFPANAPSSGKKS